MSWEARLFCIQELVLYFFDAWSTCDVQLIFMFSFYPSETGCGYSRAVLAFPTFENEDLQNFQKYEIFMQFCIFVIQKSMSNFISTIVDTCSAKNYLYGKLGVLLIRFSSHHFIVSVSEILESSKDIVATVQRLMQNCKNPSIMENFLQYTPLQANENNVSRWSSWFLFSF